MSGNGQNQEVPNAHEAAPDDAPDEDDDFGEFEGFETCDLAMTSKVRYHDQGQASGIYHFKILVPSVAAGAIIGKVGGTIVQLQKEAGASVKMSKAKDFYPGTTERVCLISGSVEGILRIHEFIMQKVEEKSDIIAKMAKGLDDKQLAKRGKQVKILVPNSTAGMIIGKSGCYIKQIKEESGAYVQISQKSKEYALAERCITVIGEMESNTIACRMILDMIVEDPQSGSCLNVSYAAVTGPVANFSPTGSPYAKPGSAHSDALNNSSNSYSSNDSLNSLSPTTTKSLHSPQTGAFPCRTIPFTGVGMGGSVTSPASVAQTIETVKTMLRDNGYSEQAVAEVNVAMNTLANYGILGCGLGVLNGVNSASVVSDVGMGMHSSVDASCLMPPGDMANQAMYASGVPGIEAACNCMAASGLMEVGSSMLGHIDNLGSGMSGLDLGLGYTSPTTSHSNDFFTVQAEEAVSEPFCRTSPALPSPSAAALPVNNNSFGLGTGLSSCPPCLRKSPTPSEQQISDTTKIDIEVGENIVGAILGPGGKALTEIQRFSGAKIQISKKGVFAPGTRNRVVTITGPSIAVNTALHLIECYITEEEAKRAEKNAQTTQS